MNRKDWVLLAVSAGKGRPLTPVQLQKSLFLLKQNMPKEVGEEFYSFRPYHYGPFDSAVYDDANELASEGYVEALSQPGQRWFEYSITPAGAELAESVRNTAPVLAVKHLEQIVAWAMRLSFGELVSKIYQLYPEMQQNSIFSGTGK